MSHAKKMFILFYGGRGDTAKGESPASNFITHVRMICFLLSSRREKSGFVGEKVCHPHVPNKRTPKGL
jgi:hypothetical protein